MNREELANKIKIAFQNNEYPGDDHIGRVEVNDFIGQKDWMNTPFDLLWWNAVNFFFFGPEGFHFFLPAFLYQILTYPEAEGMLDIVVDGLTPNPPTYTFRSIGEKAIERFTKEEKTAIVDFLKMIETLFPHACYSTLEEDKQRLKRAIEFWEGN